MIKPDELEWRGGEVEEASRVRGEGRDESKGMTELECQKRKGL